MTHLRADMLHGKKPEICNVCWKKEERGEQSYRQTYLKKFAHLFDPSSPPQMKILDLKIDNVCNLQCRMCEPISSNQIAKTLNYFRDQNLPIPNHYIYSLNFLNRDFHQEKKLKYILDVIETVKVIKITGGEPFKSKEFLWIMDHAIQNNLAKDIDLIITTNGTKFFDSYLFRLKEFKSVDFNISIDGYGTVYDYIRYPFTWNQWNERFRNLLQFMQEHQLYKSGRYRIRTSSIVSAYSWLSTYQMYQALVSLEGDFPWLEEIDFRDRIDFNLNLNPKHSELHASVLPKEILELGLERLKIYLPEFRQMPDFVNFVEYHKNQQHHKKQQAFKYMTTVLDKERQQSYGDYLEPEMTAWMDSLQFSMDDLDLKSFDFFSKLMKEGRYSDFILAHSL